MGKDRLNNSFKRWKLSYEDFRNRSRQADYEAAIEDMMERTSSKRASWYLIPANDKPYGRLATFTVLIERLGKGLSKQPRPLDLKITEMAKKLFDLTQAVVSGGGKMASPDLVETVVAHLGGQHIVAQIGARDFFAAEGRVSFRLSHPNPNGVHSVVICTQPNGFFSMECFGEIARGTLTAPLVGSAWEIIPENLATVLGRLTGIESIHHRHY